MILINVPNITLAQQISVTHLVTPKSTRPCCCPLQISFKYVSKYSIIHPDAFYNFA